MDKICLRIFKTMQKYINNEKGDTSFLTPLHLIMALFVTTNILLSIISIWVGVCWFMLGFVITLYTFIKQNVFNLSEYAWKINFIINIFMISLFSTGGLISGILLLIIDRGIYLQEEKQREDVDVHYRRMKRIKKLKNL